MIMCVIMKIYNRQDWLLGVSQSVLKIIFLNSYFKFPVSVWSEIL